MQKAATDKTEEENRSLKEKIAIRGDWFLARK